MPSRPRPFAERLLFGVIVAAVLAAYLSAFRHAGSRFALAQPDGLYAPLTDAFLSGQTYLKEAPNPALTQLANPYAGYQGVPRLHDASYFHNRYYLYFGPAPVILLFAPWRLVTGTFLSEAGGTLLFGITGFLIGVWLLAHTRRHYFPHASGWVFALVVAVWGLGSYMQALAFQASVYPVPIMCAVVCELAALAFLARALLAPHRLRWLALMGLSWGLAVAARPNHLFALPAAALAAGCVLWQAHRRETRGLRAQLRLFGAFALPIVLIGAALAFYNWVRFGQITEFGTTYMFAAQDQRHMAMSDPRHLPGGLATLLFDGADYSPYFPFIFPKGGWGLVRFCPFALLALLPLGALWRQRRSCTPELLACLVPLLASSGILATLAMLPTQNDRYLVDFLPPLLVLALGAALGWSQATASGSAYRRWAVRLTLAALGAWTLVHAVGLNFRQMQIGGHGNRIAALLNQPAHRLAAWTGHHPGPLRITAVLPHAEPESYWALVVTGRSSDVLYLKFTDAEHIQVGFWHEGSGGPLSAPIAIDPARAHTFVVDLGSLYPPADHPALRQQDAATIAALKRRVRVSVDGQLALDAAAVFYDSHPWDVRIGENPRGLVAPPHHKIYIRAVEPLGIAAGLAETTRLKRAPLRLHLTFPRFVTYKTDPLVSTGHATAGDLLYVSYVGPGKLKFGHDSWGSGAWETAVLDYEPGRDYELDVLLGSLADTHDGLGPLMLRFDGTLLVSTERPFHPTQLPEICLGYNGMGSSAAAATFSGRILSAENIELPPVGPADRLAPGPVRLTVRFPELRDGHQEPLLTSGQTGAGDFVYVVYDSANHIRIGYDHWGVGGPLSPPLAIDFNVPHVLEISTGALFPLADSAAWGNVPPAVRTELLSTVRVKLDGQVVLEHRATPYPATSTEIAIAQNPIGGSTCERDFTGQIFARESLPLPGQAPCR